MTSHGDWGCTDHRVKKIKAGKYRGKHLIFHLRKNGPQGRKYRVVGVTVSERQDKGWRHLRAFRAQAKAKA